jgi:hypothetical protein
MTISITGSKYSGTVSSYSNNQLTCSGVSFVSGDFNTPRIIGVWDSTGTVYKGLSWVRQYVSATVLEVELDFIDNDGLEYTPVNGDTFLVSKNFSESVTTGLSVTGNIVTQTDNVLMGTNGVSNSVCFYDEAKTINVTNDNNNQCYRFAGGLAVFGHLKSYNNKEFFNPVNIYSADGGNSGDQIAITNLSAKVWWLGGILKFDSTPARLPGGGNGSTTLSPAEWQKWWGIETNADLVSPDGGTAWSSNAVNQQFINCTSLISSTNAIGFRLADSDLQGGSCKITGGACISVFGSDAAGTYNIGAVSGERFIVLDIGTNTSKTAFWRSNLIVSQTINATNIISTDFRCGYSVSPGSDANNDADLNIFFKDTYSNIFPSTKIFVCDSIGGVVDSGTSIAGENLELSVEYASVTGHTQTITETSWKWAGIAYLKNISSNSFSVVDYETIDGTAKNVSHGAVMAQLDDTLLSETSKAVVDAYTSIDNSGKFYDRAKAYLYDNYDGESATLVTKTADLIDAGSFDIVIDATAAQVIDLTGNTLTIKSSVFTGDITTTGTLWFVNGATGVGRFTSSAGVQVSISLTFNNLSTSTVEIFDNTGTSVQRYTNQTGTLVYSTPLGSTGTWSYIIDRIGYRPIISDFDPTLNDLIIDGTQSLLLTAQGNTMYSGSSSSLVNITYDFVTPQLNIEIGNGGVSPQVIFDEVEQSLVTANGMRWQKENNTLVTFDDLPAVGQMLFMQDNIRLKRASASDVNSAVNGYILSTQSTPVDGVNGNVNYVASPDYASPIWDALLSSHNVSSSFGALLQLLETKAQADTRQAALISEHNDTQADIAALNDFNPATDTVANVTLVATTTTNTDMRGTDSANTIAPDNAGITQIQTDISNLNDISPAQVNAEVDTALGDYDAPTKTELDAVESNIIASIPSVGNIADGVWDEPYNQHTTAGTFGKLMDLLRKANRSIDGEVTGTPTTSTFQTNISGYISGAFDHELIVFTSGALDGEARPILEYSATNGTFTFEEEWSQTPSSSDEFVILPYHTHPISEIQSGLAKTIELNAVETNLLAQHTDTQSLINALNDLSEAQVKAQADQALTDYDAPTKAELDLAESNIIVEIDANEAKIDLLETKIEADARQVLLVAENDATQTLISALNDLSSAEVKTQADQALADYDGPTKAELDAAQASIEAAIAGLNDLDATAVAQGVWDYLQSETTVSASMKEAIEITLKNAKLIPATI